MRPIDAIELQKHINKRMPALYSPISFMIEEIPTLDVKPVIKGKWIPVSNATSMYSCSKCGRIITKDSVEDLQVDYPYCHCGADMREVEE